MTRTTLRVGAKVALPLDPRKNQTRPLREQAPLPPFWGYQDDSNPVDLAPVDVVGTPANDGAEET